MSVLIALAAAPMLHALTLLAVLSACVLKDSVELEKNVMVRKIKY